MAISFSNLLAFNSVESTDVAASPALVENVFSDSWLIPEVTFTKKFDKGNASIVYSRRLGKGTVVRTKATDAGGLDFVHTQTADSIVAIQIDNVISRSEKCYEAIERSRESGTMLQKYEEVLQEVVEALQEDAEKLLRAGATALASTAQCTDLTIFTEITNALAQYRIAKGRALPILKVSEKAKAMILQNAAKVGFTPVTGDEAYTNNYFGTIAGMKVIADNNIDLQNLAAPTAPQVEFYIYNAVDFAVIINLEVFHAKDAGAAFDGYFAQGQLLWGGAVMRPELVFKKTYTI